MICKKHVKKKCWESKPVPSVYLAEALKRPLTLPSLISNCMPPKKRVYQEDEVKAFQKINEIKKSCEINKTHLPIGFQSNKTSELSLFFHLGYDETTGFFNDF